MSLCPNCIKGVRHEGTPEGEIEFIGGVRCYVSTPSGEYNEEKAVLFLPSIFGIDLINAQVGSSTSSIGIFRKCRCSLRIAPRG
ncbi:hypothetical protein M404DRAFT_516379 [Pisolithus tinctorius Marx 270]|uniref:Uncharacterized protein n=1 Tax=Pisolithus tinctorius Marx 270 TaxID=870435 RepID=A0A0C3J6M6_PISTI|nr:hypothetical protein M404DRAFT_516379 [Pisolithus tinctorius Marx 270]